MFNLSQAYGDAAGVVTFWTTSETFGDWWSKAHPKRNSFVAVRNFSPLTLRYQCHYSMTITSVQENWVAMRLIVRQYK